MEYSEDELNKLLNSYHPIGVYRLLCAIYDKTFSMEGCLLFLRNCNMDFLNKIQDLLSTLTNVEQYVINYCYGLRALHKLGNVSGLAVNTGNDYIFNINKEAIRKIRHPTNINILSECLTKFEEEIFRDQIDLNDQLDNGDNWKSLPLYPDYLISSDGTIYDFVNKRILNPSRYTTRGNYLYVSLRTLSNKRQIVKIHTLVAEAYLGPKPIGCVVDHIDQNPENNNYKNLRYITNSENQKNNWNHSGRKIRS